MALVVRRWHRGRTGPARGGTRVLGDTCNAATGTILATSLGSRRVDIGIGIGMMSSVTSGRQHTHNQKNWGVGRSYQAQVR